MINWKPSDLEIACPATYETVKTRVPPGSNFEPGKAYSVVVNDVTETFVAQYSLRSLLITPPAQGDLRSS